MQIKDMWPGAYITNHVGHTVHRLRFNGDYLHLRPHVIFKSIFNLCHREQFLMFRLAHLNTSGLGQFETIFRFREDGNLFT